MLARYRSVEWLLAHQLFRIAIALPPTEEIDYDIVICNLLNPVAGLGTNVAGIRDLDFTMLGNYDYIASRCSSFRLSPRKTSRNHSHHRQRHLDNGNWAGRKASLLY